ncbi:MAG: DUF6732 family protein [Pseudomonadota bacterium]
MRYLLILIMTTCGQMAIAHPGHLAEVAGHSHWVAAGALVVAGALALLLAKGRKNPEETDAEEADPEDDTAQEA